MSQWYCKIGDHQHGPITTRELKALAESGELRPTDRVRKADGTAWAKASAVRGLFPEDKHEPATPATGPAAEQPLAGHPSPLAEEPREAAPPGPVERRVGRKLSPRDILGLVAIGLSLVLILGAAWYALGRKPHRSYGDLPIAAATKAKPPPPADSSADAPPVVAESKPEPQAGSQPKTPTNPPVGVTENQESVPANVSRSNATTPASAPAGNVPASATGSVPAASTETQQPVPTESPSSAPQAPLALPVEQAGQAMTPGPQTPATEPAIPVQPVAGAGDPRPPTPDPAPALPVQQAAAAKMPVGTPLAEGKTPPNGPVPRADASGTPDPRDEAHFQKLQQLFEQTRTLLTELRATQNEVAKVKNEIQQAQAAINAAAVQIPQLTMQIANIAGQLNGPPMPLNIRQQMKAQGAVLEGQLGMLVQAKQNSEKQLEFALPRKLSAAEGNAGDAGRKCDKMLPQWIALSDPFGDQSRAAHLRTAELCSGWLTSEPEFIAGYLMRGFARLHVGEADGAKKDFDRVAQFGHGRTMSKNEQEVLAAALSGRSVLHAETKQEAQAKSDFGDAGDLCPKSVLVSVFRGRANALLGKTRSAIDDFLKATKLDSKEPAGFHELAWLLATTPTLNEGKRAADFGRTACELTNWNHWQCLDAYALASAANASFEEAVKWGTKALEIAPPDVRPAVEERLKLYRAGVAPANVKRR